jgi:hypothetical protein
MTTDIGLLPQPEPSRADPSTLVLSYPKRQTMKLLDLKDNSGQDDQAHTTFSSDVIPNLA